MADDAGKTGVTSSDPNVAGNGEAGAAASAGEVEGLKAALKAEREKRQGVERSLAKLEGTVEGLKSGQRPAEKTEKTYTRAQLRAAVNEGKITEDQMDAILESQTDARIDKSIREATAKFAKASSTEAETTSELARYAESHPDLMEQGSELRGKVQAAYDRLIRRGSPDDVTTQLTAVEMTLGPLTANKGRKKDPETHQETGGPGGNHERGDNEDALFKGIPPKLREYYKKQQGKGAFAGAAGQKALKAELDIARSRARH